MGNLRDKFAGFMYGRYGTDQLYKALIALYFVLFIGNLFLNSIILTTLMWAVLLLTLFRTFSRNVSRRRMENDKFMKIWKTVKSRVLLYIRMIREIRTRRYRKCPHCKSIIRLPRKIGKHIVICPYCHDEFPTHIRW